MILPELISLQIYNFTLYGSGKNVFVDLDKSTVVLAGANGIGKSTFLNLIVYAFTGTTKNPSYSFVGIYDINSMDFSKDYFKGRVSNIDIASASIHLKFKLNNDIITINRKFDTEGGFNSFQVNNDEPNYNESNYKEFITKNMNLANFEQFIFIINYVLLFDESRSTLFWNTRLLTSAINIFLGLDSNLAEKADMLTKQINSADSSFRNTSWQISKLEKYISELTPGPITKSKSEIVTNDIIDEYNTLLDSLENINKNIEETKLMFSSNKAKSMELTLNINKLKRIYDKEYKKLFNVLSPKKLIRNHIDIQNLYLNKHCNFCNSSNVDLTYFESQLENNLCPICNSNINQDDVEINTSSLLSIDSEIEDLTLKLNNTILEQENLEKDIADLESQRNEISTKIDNYENEYGRINLISKKNDTLRKYETDLSLLKKKREQFKNERDEAKAKAIIIREQVANKIREIQAEFVPIFNNLAKAFIGLDVSFNIQEIEMYHRPEFKFQLIIDDSERFFEHQLSESQKFFIDIALRMAFILYTHKKNTNTSGFLLLDTPEGSLDLAYEANAGLMLSEYVKEGSQLIMTTNINSSGLLKSLARNSNKSEFNLINMLNWTQLSEVQKRSREIIENKLLEIEKEIGEDYGPLH